MRSAATTRGSSQSCRADRAMTATRGESRSRSRVYREPLDWAEPREEGREVGGEEQRLAAEFGRLEFAALNGGIE